MNVRSHLRAVVAPVAMAIVLLLMAGCAGDPQAAPKGGPVSAGKPPAVVPSPTVKDFDDAGLPLDQYLLTADQWSDLDYATKLLASECMKRFGISWDPGSPVGFDIMRDRTNQLGLVEERKAARFGYHADPAKAADLENKDATDPNRLSNAEGKILTGPGPGGKPAKGVPEGGCYGEARRKIGWDADGGSWLQLVSNEATHRAFADERAAALAARWSACMKDAGYDYKRPQDAAANRAWWKDEDAGPSRAEIDTAVADVRCKHKVNYVGVMTAILAAYQQQTVEKNAERLAELKDKNEQAFKNAAAVLSGRRPG